MYVCIRFHCCFFIGAAFWWLHATAFSFSFFFVGFNFFYFNVTRAHSRHTHTYTHTCAHTRKTTSNVIFIMFNAHVYRFPSSLISVSTPKCAIHGILRRHSTTTTMANYTHIMIRKSTTRTYNDLITIIRKSTSYTGTWYWHWHTWHAPNITYTHIFPFYVRYLAYFDFICRYPACALFLRLTTDFKLEIRKIKIKQKGGRKEEKRGRERESILNC